LEYDISTFIPLSTCKLYPSTLLTKIFLLFTVYKLYNPAGWSWLPASLLKAYAEVARGDIKKTAIITAIIFLNSFSPFLNFLINLLITSFYIFLCFFHF